MLNGDGRGMVNRNLCGQHFHKPSKAAMSSFIVPARKPAEGWASSQKQTFSAQKFGFINGVDNVNWPPYRDSVHNPVCLWSKPCVLVVKAMFLTSCVECIILKVYKVLTNEQNDAKEV